MKILLALTGPTGLLLFALFAALSIAGAPVGGSNEGDLLSDFAVAAVFAAAILLLQIAALAMLRFLPWPGPRLTIEGRAEEDRLRDVFE